MVPTQRRARGPDFRQALATPSVSTPLLPCTRSWTPWLAANPLSANRSVQRSVERDSGIVLRVGHGAERFDCKATRGNDRLDQQPGALAIGETTCVNLGTNRLENDQRRFEKPVGSIAIHDSGSHRFPGSRDCLQIGCLEGGFDGTDSCFSGCGERSCGIDVFRLASIILQAFEEADLPTEVRAHIRADGSGKGCQHNSRDQDPGLAYCSFPANVQCLSPPVRPAACRLVRLRRVRRRQPVPPDIMPNRREAQFRDPTARRDAAQG